MKQCDTCIYGNKSEYEKPCIVYKGENCEVYKKRGDDMEYKEALSLIESYLKSGYAHNTDDFKQALNMAIKALESISKYKDAYGKGWDDGAKATYEHLKMCEEEQEPSCPFYKIDEDGHGLCKNHRLEQEPCDDAISREAVQNYIAKYLSQYLYNDVREAVEAIDEYIGELPSVTQKSETVTEFADRCRECGAKYGKLLKQEQSGDLISRQYLLDNCVVDKVTMPYVPISKIQEAPSVRPQEPKTGHWERHYIRPNVYADLLWHCSACGDKCGYNNANLFEYCPHCGAKMFEPQESEE